MKENNLKKDFLVVIAGRENVGKSSIFNRLIMQKRAIVDDYPGVTRDRIFGESEWDGKRFSVVDTGGFFFDGEDKIKSIVARQASEIIKDSGLTLLVTDARAGVLPDDVKIAEIIRKHSAKCALVVNKVDVPEKAGGVYDFYRLGIDKVFPVSAEHGLGFDALLDHISSLMPEGGRQEKEEEKFTRIAIVGKENVGKSSLFNTIAKQELSIVTDIPGTTRDSIDTLVAARGRQLLFIDTAGVKKRKSMRKKAEEYSIGRAFANIKRADMVIHVLDVDAGIQETDKKVLGYAAEHHKGIIIAINKWDLVPSEEKDEVREKYIKYLASIVKFVAYAPVVFVSALNGRGTEKLIDVVFQVEKQYNLRVKTSVLNRVFREVIYKKPPSSRKGDLKIYYISQVSAGPPVFALFLNKKEKLKDNYLKYVENKLRESFGFAGVPLNFRLKEKSRKEDK
ncbi:MAG TPA: ribosome biogenesis GTPase Der [bacterium]|nr:ribosome biogenesis GTPase Der [bacterium]